MLAAFGPGYVYQIARAQWRLAEALVESGRRDEAPPSGARRAIPPPAREAPLSAALDDLPAAPGLTTGTGAATSVDRAPRSPFASLTDREL